jgi:hypothetical protein
MMLSMGEAWRQYILHFPGFRKPFRRDGPWKVLFCCRSTSTTKGPCRASLIIALYALRWQRKIFYSSGHLSGSERTKKSSRHSADFFDLRWTDRSPTGQATFYSQLWSTMAYPLARLFDLCRLLDQCRLFDHRLVDRSRAGQETFCLALECDGNPATHPQCRLFDHRLTDRRLEA